MGAPSSPSAKANWVLETMGIKDAPATHLDEIAKSQGVRVGKENLPDDPNLSGALLFQGNRRAILINTLFGNQGRVNFTFAHELGHHYLGHTPTLISDGISGFRCTPEDMEKGNRTKEIEANQFAVSLLMPEKQFRPLMAGAILDYTLINGLARQFYVSKHACCNRLLEFTRDAYIVIRSKDFEVTEQRASLAAKRHLLPLNQIPLGTAAYGAIASKNNQLDFTECDPNKWLSGINSAFHLYECTRGDWTHGVAMTILKLL